MKTAQFFMWSKNGVMNVACMYRFFGLPCTITFFS